MEVLLLLSMVYYSIRPLELISLKWKISWSTSSNAIIIPYKIYQWIYRHHKVLTGFYENPKIRLLIHYYFPASC